MTTLITAARGPCWFSAVIYNGYRSMPNRLPLQLDGHYVHFNAHFTVVIFNMGFVCVYVCVVCLFVCMMCVCVECVWCVYGVVKYACGFFWGLVCACDL